MRLGFVQTEPVFGEPARNVARMVELLDTCDADVAVLPELATSGYVFAAADEVERLAEPATGPSITELGRWAKARGRLLVVGFPEKADGAVYNAAAAIGPDGVLAVYRKIHLFSDEKRWFAPGDAPAPVIEWRGVSFGLMICFDWRFPEVARSLALRGAQIICHPSNLVMTHCPDAMITRSIENRVFTVTANRTGVEDRGGTRLSFTGLSQITHPRGDRLAVAPPEGEFVSVVEIDPADALDKMITPRNHLWRDRRPQLYATDQVHGARNRGDSHITGEPEAEAAAPTGRQPDSRVG